MFNHVSSSIIIALGGIATHAGAVSRPGISSERSALEGDENKRSLFQSVGNGMPERVDNSEVGKALVNSRTVGVVPGDPDPCPSLP